MISVPDDVIFEIVDGQAVLLSLTTGIYFLMNPMGTRMFELLEAHGGADEVRAILEAEHAVDPGVLSEDLDRFIDELVQRDLLVRT
jgi:Coenzyme PQQ synthesis protein D (PqqD)